MKIFIAFFICFMLVSSQKVIAQHSIITQKDSLAMIHIAGLKVSFFEAVLNYLADPHAKIKDGLQKNSYKASLEKRIFMDHEVLIEDDLNPGVQGTVSPPIFITIEAYMNKFREVYRTEDPKSVTFRVSKIKQLIPTEKGYYVRVFFESRLEGNYQAVAGLSYQQTYRVATLKIEKSEVGWQAFITEVAFATSEQVDYFVPQEYKAHKEKMKDKKRNEKMHLHGASN